MRCFHEIFAKKARGYVNLRNFLTMSGLQFWSDKEEQYLGMNEKYVNIIFQFLIKYTVYLHHLVN